MLISFLPGLTSFVVSFYRVLFVTNQVEQASNRQ